MSVAKIKRPIPISIICIIGWFMVILSFVYAFSPAVKKTGEFFPALYSLVVCLQFISLVGIWYMKKWGANLFVASFSGKYILLLLMNDFSFASISFIISFILVLLFLIILLV